MKLPDIAIVIVSFLAGLKTARDTSDADVGQAVSNFTPCANCFSRI